MTVTCFINGGDGTSYTKCIGSSWILSVISSANLMFISNHFLQQINLSVLQKLVSVVL